MFFSEDVVGWRVCRNMSFVVHGWVQEALDNGHTTGTVSETYKA